MSFWNIIWFIVVSFVFFAYLMVMFRIIVDLFSDPTVSGVAKAVWMIALVFLPFLTSFVYLIVRGNGMAERASTQMRDVRAQQDSYIRQVAGTAPSATDQITQAKQLMDSGAIDAAEFASLKAKALA
jgi:hypothetical protein